MRRAGHHDARDGETSSNRSPPSWIRTSPTASVLYPCWALRAQLCSPLSRAPHRSAAPARSESAAARKQKERQWRRTGQGATERRAARDAGNGRPGTSRVPVGHVGRRGAQGSVIFQGTADTSRGRLQSTVFPTAAATMSERGRADLYAFLEVFRGAVRSVPRGPAPAARRLKGGTATAGGARGSTSVSWGPQASAWCAAPQLWGCRLFNVLL